MRGVFLAAILVLVLLGATCGPKATPEEATTDPYVEAFSVALDKIIEGYDHYSAVPDYLKANLPVKAAEELVLAKRCFTAAKQSAEQMEALHPSTPAGEGQISISLAAEMKSAATGYCSATDSYLEAIGLMQEDSGGLIPGIATAVAGLVSENPVVFLSGLLGVVEHFAHSEMLTSKLGSVANLERGASHRLYWALYMARPSPWITENMEIPDVPFARSRFVIKIEPAAGHYA